MARNPIGDRLALILEDLGYVDDDGDIDIDYAAKVICRRSGRTFAAARLRTILEKEGRLWLDEAAIIADGLGIDLRELAYDDGEIPKSSRRSGNPLDDLDVI